MQRLNVKGELSMDVLAMICCEMKFGQNRSKLVKINFAETI
jgi:hypothetical protein